MQNRLNLPPDLLHLMEKRDGKERREEQQLATQRLESGEDDAAIETGPDQPQPQPQPQTRPEQRSDAERRRAIRRQADR